MDAAGQVPATPRFQGQPSERLSQDQLKKINQVHVNLGHIGRAQMLSLFKAAGAKDVVMNHIKNNFKCEQCDKQRRPVERKKATMSRTFAFNRHVGIDVFYIALNGRTHAFLNMVCHGTNYQQVCWLADSFSGTPSSREVWTAFLHHWIRPFGMPEVVLSDGGSEFKDVFERSLEQHNVLQVVCDAASPWQNGKAERHGGWVKERAEMELSAGQSVISTSQDLDELISCVVAHKNRWFSRGGFSPCQLVFGSNPSIPADLLCDRPQDLAWQDIEADGFDQDTAVQSKSSNPPTSQRTLHSGQCQDQDQIELARKTS